MKLSKKTLEITLKGVLIAAILLVLAVLQKARLQALTEPSSETIPTQAKNQEQQESLELQILKVLPDFGFRNIIADWTFLKFLQYFGNLEHRQITGYSLSGDYFDIIIERDPYAYDPYIFLSSSVSLFAAQPERAVALQEKGLQSLSPDLPPRSYFIWRSKGIDELLFLGDHEAASRSHQIAAEWAAESPYPSAEDDQYSLARAAEFYATNPNSLQAQLNAWSQVLASAQDDQTRAVVARQIEDLGAEIVPNEQGRYTIRYNPEQEEAENEE
ncbi:hypothetical protein PN498_05755 [Oscillatoria sp. CS-180]|uniref:hypothetical protein n=1 Tax=Oscillatoria sp. CS-180 TaxID=3021720 RepID=UPI00232B126D|nr:hypothetical protein [Oscillatoria sp. CS-180]MDB9525484.1 hypothetical protein [Oscillatoria sp. CS-180]